MILNVERNWPSPPKKAMAFGLNSKSITNNSKDEIRTKVRKYHIVFAGIHLMCRFF